MDWWPIWATSSTRRAWAARSTTSPSLAARPSRTRSTGARTTSWCSPHCRRRPSREPSRSAGARPMSATARSMEPPYLRGAGSTTGLSASGMRGLGDLAGADAGGADVDALRGPVDDGPHPLDVGIPAPLHPAMGVTDRVAERGMLAAYLTDRCHDAPPLQ